MGREIHTLACLFQLTCHCLVCQLVAALPVGLSANTVRVLTLLGYFCLLYTHPVLHDT